MRVLFLHNNFPAQYLNLASTLARDPRHQVLFVTQNTDTEFGGIQKVIFKPSRDAHASTHFYVRSYERAVLHGQAVFRVALKIKEAGFVPDVICGHSGWGLPMFMKDAFPDVPLLCYFEWFTNAHGSDLDFDPADPITLDDVLRYRASNASMLVDLCSCDRGLSPTQWQLRQFPAEFQSKISVLHDGVDTNYFLPNPGYRLELPDLDLSHVDELITYVSRGMDLYRGFPQFIEAIAQVLDQRPKAHVAIVAAERVAYGPARPDGKSYKEWMLEKVSLDLSRVHFIGNLPYGLYRKVLQASSVHVYLTRPFVLSWSFMEAMASGCLIVASDTAPVREMIQDGHNGLLVDFFDTPAIAQRIVEALENQHDLQPLRDRARATIVENYALADLLPRHIALLEELAGASR
ncbi:MAG: glycosyltransferase [Synechococcales cyanobacterium T60_A2020_003]|nr:glycosyltransferase [Synechococcales cyanobacterium T60_A2020_003]